MNDDDQSKIVQITTLLATFFEVYYDESLTPELKTKLTKWAYILASYDIADIRNSFKAYIVKNKSFAPNLAGLVSAIETQKSTDELKQQEQRTTNSEIAWQSVVRAIHEVGMYRTPLFADERTNYAIAQIGGWVTLCNSEESKLCFIKKAFVEAYQNSFRNEFSKPRLVGLTAEVAIIDSPICDVEQVKMIQN